MDYGSIVVLLAMSSVITVALLLAFQLYSFESIAISALASISFSSLIVLCIEKARTIKMDGEASEEFAEKVKLISVQEHKASSKKIMSYVGNSCTDESLKKTLDSAGIFSRMGYPLSTAISKSHSNVEKFGKVLGRNMPISQNWLSNAVEEYQNKRSERDSVKASRMQRYATANMFISTIAPSFVIFGFIGDMVISQKAIGIIGLILALDLLIPFVFTISNFVMLGRLIE